MILRILYNARNTRLGESQNILNDILIDEIKQNLYIFYECNHIEENNLYDGIKRYLSSMPVRHFIHSDWKFIVSIADYLKLKIKDKPNLGRTRILYPIKTISKVTMEKNGKLWNLKNFTTISIERWGISFN